METNIIATLRCVTKNNGKHYYGGDETYDLSVTDKFVEEYRRKLLDLKPIKKYDASKWYENMHVHERYLFDKSKYEELERLHEELCKEKENPRYAEYDDYNGIVQIKLDGLYDWKEDGTITLDEKVICTDPCYDIDVWCLIILDNVLSGNYKCFHQRELNEDRIATIKAVHEDYLDYDPSEHVKGEVGVDSGQAGIFDFEYYKYQKENNEENFYDCACNATYKTYREKNPNYKTPFEILNELKMIYPGLDVKSEEFSEKYCEWLDNHSNCMHRTIYKAESTASVLDDGENKGFCSSSGYGDGGYNLFVARNEDGKIVGFKIVFIGFSENPDEDEE